MKVKFRLSKYKDKENLYQVQLYCIYKKHKVFLDTGVKVTEGTFDPAANPLIKGKGQSIEEDNDKLWEQHARVKKIIKDYMAEHDGAEPDVFYLRDQYMKPKKPEEASHEVKAVFKRWIEGVKESGIKGKKDKVADVKIYRTVLNDIEFLFKRSLFFKDLNHDFFEKLMAHWTSSKMNLQNSTINKRATCLKIFLRHEPLNHYKFYEEFSTGLKNIKRHPVIIPTEEEFEKIVNAENYVDKDKWTKDMDTARDYFVVGCSTSLRYGTISSLTKAEVKFDREDPQGYIKTFSRKTEMPDVRIPLNDISRHFLEKLFGKSRSKARIKYMSNWKVNQNLHLLFKELKFNSIETVLVKRGAYAVPVPTEKWQAMTMHDSRAYFISKCVNSKVVSLGTTLDWSTHQGLGDVVKYIHKGHQQAEQMRELFGNILQPKDSFPNLDTSTLLRKQEKTIEKGK